MKISEISIKRSTIPVVIFTILALAGIFCYTLLNKELIPNMEVPVNAVMTIYPGAAPSEVESSVTKKVENAVSAVAGIEKITSFSLEGISAVMITYKDGVDSDLSLQECERKVNAIINNLPENIKDPQFMKVDLNMFPIMSLAVNSDIPEKEFYDIVDKDLAPQLSQIKGVASVEILGGNKREIEVKADAQKLKQYGLSLLQVQQAIGASNVDFPTGKIKNDDTKYIVRLAGKFSNLEQIREQIVGASKDGSVIRVCDVATVVDGTRKANKLARFNGQPVIGLTIQKQTDGNAVEISKEVHEKIAEFEEEYASNNLKFTITSDSSEFTQSAIDSVMMDLLLAIILVSVTMLLFLHTFRNLMFVFISIPLSIISTFAFFYIFGFSLNLLTLLAMSIVVGVIVDDAIVVLENIYRHLEMGKSRREASLDAVKEIGLTVTSITIVLIAVFLPIGLTDGVTGQLLRSFSLVIVMSILVSLLVSFTIVPLLTSRLGKLKEFDKKRSLDRFLMSFEKIVNSFKSAIMSALNWTLSHKRITIITVVALFISSFMLVSKGFIQTEFMDAGDRGEFILTMELERTSTLEKTTSKCQSIERKILSYPEVEHVFTKVGTKGGSVSFMETPYGAEFSIKMVPTDKRDISSRIFSKKLQYDLQAEFPGPKFKTQEVSIMGTTSSPITIYVRGNDLDKVKSYSNVVLNELRAIQGTTDVESSLESGDKELVVKFDREKLAKLGLTIGEIGSQMYLSFEGNRDLKYSEGGNEYDIYVSLDEFDRERRSDIENISFTNRMGQTITLSQVADISESESPSM
ncbi:MAG: efflux RND transporter permease subunit, partial [Bacteroidia bacterium]|nr:efflux RND transporter permease subunit [Bacteroidia bacterium]